jgi:hypothetical protein
MKQVEPTTPLGALAAALRRASRFNPEVECAPQCILWPDKEAQWRPIIPALQTELPQLLVLGPHNEAQRTGPAIWLRCAMAGRISAVPTNPAHPPILYLPEVGRQDLRAIEHCPESLKAIAELQYRGQVFSQANGKDWTVLSFLKSEQGGLGLDVSQDREAKDAMLLALRRVMDEPLEVLRSRRLDAAWFNTLLSGGDPIRDLLQWINNPAAYRASRTDHEWAAFTSVCKTQFAFHPQDGELVAATRLATRTGPWTLIWQRYAEAPALYPGIPALIRRCSPPIFDMLTDVETAGGWPQWNDGREADLQASLRALANCSPHEARETVLRLERDHGARRRLVWATLDQAPLARSLEPLSELARITRRTLAAGTLRDMQEAYATEGWRADDAVLRALEQARTPETFAAITSAIRSIYLPWAEDAARYLQGLVAAGKPPGGVREPGPPAYVTKNQCVMFVDGLRFDLARRLTARLQERGFSVQEQASWVALPSVTATGKAAVAPVADRIEGTMGSTEFEPVVQSTGAALSAQQLRKLMTEAGWQVLSGVEDVGAPGSQAWCEFGNIDHEGHERGWKLAQHVDGMLDEISARIQALLAAGWGQVRVVTDHGWLLMPGGLPKIELPKALATTKWGRCAALKPGAHSDERLYPWYWNPQQTFALADGIACYKQGEDYSHGGLSLQECLTLQLTVVAAAPAQHAELVISDKGWKGLRLSISIESVPPGAQADIRLRPGDPDSSVVATTKRFSAQGSCSVVVENEDLEGQPAFLVILDSEGALLAQQPVTIGVDE